MSAMERVMPARPVTDTEMPRAAEFPAATALLPRLSQITTRVALDTPPTAAGKPLGA